MNSNGMRGALIRMFGCSIKSLAIFRITLASLLLCELGLRFRFLHPFYSNEGTHPLRLLHLQTDNLYKFVCVHCYNDTMYFQSILLCTQVVLSLGMLVGYYTPICALLSWWLYVSLTLRNTWLNFILDRYFHYLLFYCAMLPTHMVWSIDANRMTKTESRSEGNNIIVSLATVALKMQIFWIYIDAGVGKYMDPQRGWTWNPEPPLLPALDAYTRHTVGAQYMYGLLGPEGLRFMSPIVVWLEMLAAPVALMGLALDWPRLTNFAIIMICQLHIGIAITVRNTVLLSLVACVAWMSYLPDKCALIDLIDNLCSVETNSDKKEKKNSKSQTKLANKSSLNNDLRNFAIVSIICGSIWFELFSEECNQSMKHIWSVLLHNRWNVFISSEEYVTWEIAPGRLADGSIVDVWGKSTKVSWDMPGSGAPCTSTSRPGRWRSFPYLAELNGEEGDALWNYLCNEWDREHKFDPNKKLLRYNFFMLQADVLPNMGFSPTRKRLIHSHSCFDRTNETSILSTSTTLNEL